MQIASPRKSERGTLRCASRISLATKTVAFQPR